MIVVWWAEVGKPSIGLCVKGSASGVGASSHFTLTMHQKSYE